MKRRSVRGLFEEIFKRPIDKAAAKKAATVFKTLTAYQPAFSTWRGSIYESELLRAAIWAKARHAAKLKIGFKGSAKAPTVNALKNRPNPWQTWSQFLARLMTILEVQTNAWIAPILRPGKGGEWVVSGIFPLLPSNVELVEYGGQLWIRYKFQNGETGMMEMNRCGLMVKMQYQDDFFGPGNDAMIPTMELINMNRQGILEGIRNGATFRFAAKLTSLTDPEDISREMKRFNENALRGESGGILLFPTEYDDIRQLEQKPFGLNADQQKLIETNVYNYTGVNEDVLQNKAYGDKWTAFYDGEIEFFAIQFWEVLTHMIYSPREIEQGNEATVSANRLQYASTKEKLEVSSQMTDRGIMTRNEAREIWGLPPVEGGDRFLIRGEYKDAEETEPEKDEPAEEGGDGDADQ